jgi:hypothetical protein
VISSFVHDPIHFLSKAMLALDLVLWLCWLPMMLCIHGIFMLLQRLDRSTQLKKKTPMDLKDVVAVVTRICEQKLFHARIFPQRCLRQSLALYRTLSQMGYPVKIHFGALKDGEDLYGHSWVTMHGEPVADTARSEIFKVVYSYPPERVVSSSRCEIDGEINGGVHA